MSQQPWNMRRSAQKVRRHWILVIIVTLIGLGIGAGYSVLHPPLVSSSALVGLPDNPPLPVGTEAVIASSEPVLSLALPNIRPPMALQTLEKRVTAKSVTSNVISITAQGATAQQAENAANAVASAYRAYDRTGRVPRVTVQQIQSATTTTGMGAPGQDALDGGLGLLAGLLAGVVMAVLIRRRGRRLTDLDDIAHAIGVPVLAAVPVGHPSDAAGWAHLLESYAPGPVHAWRLRQALSEVGVTERAMQERGAVSVTVVSMSADPRALALGPQLAAYAASLLIPTVLVLGPQQDTNATAALYTACGAPSASLPRYLRTIAAGARSPAIPPAARLVVVVTVVDGNAPQLPAALRTHATLLAVAAGAATAEQLARVAAAAAASGGDITGLLVADPDPADQTSGRIQPSARAARHTAAAGRQPVHTARAAAPVPGPAHVAPGPANVAPGPANVAPGPANVSPGPATVAPGPANVAPGPANVAPRPAHVAPGPASGVAETAPLPLLPMFTPAPAAVAPEAADPVSPAVPAKDAPAAPPERKGSSPGS